MEKFPAAFLARLKNILPAGEVDAYLETCTEPLPKVIRVTNKNNSVTSPPAGACPDFSGGSLKEADWKFPTPDNWTLRPTAVPEGYFIDRTDQADQPLGKTLEHFTGQIYSQSLSSMLPVVVLNPQPGEKILDLCAAPGSKTTFLAQRMHNTGLVVANEPSGTRAKKLSANLDRLGTINTVVVQSDGTILNNFFAQEFDRILLDAPCSSEGYGRRDNKFFAKQWSPDSIYQNAKLQKRLIESAWQMLAPGGIMVYSTCTSAPEENEAVVQHLLNTFPESAEILPTELDIPAHGGLAQWEEKTSDPNLVQHARRFYPHLRNEQWNSESFFVVKLRKTAALKIPPAKKPAYTTEIKLHKKNQAAEIITKLAKQFGLPKTWPEVFGHSKPHFYSKQGLLYLTTLEGTGFIGRNLFRRAGLRVMDKDENLTTEFAMQIAPHATTNVLELDAEQTQRWLQGYDLPLEEVSLFKGDLEGLKTGTSILIRHGQHGLGWGKMVNGKIKNKLDRSLVF